MIYLDNAATTFPKPRAVGREMQKCIERYAGNPGRGAHPISLAAANAVYDTRAELCELFNVSNEENVIFTKNTTEALCLAIFGILQHGDHVITTDIEHNSVARALYRMTQTNGIRVDTLSALDDDETLIKNFEAMINKSTRALVCLHASNICPRVLPIKRLGEICKKNNIIFILDAAQSAGIYDIDMSRDGITVLCAPGHKGLFGPGGSGFALFCDGFDFSKLTPLICGGTGVDSMKFEMGNTSPESYEAGTLAVPSIAGLREGIKFVKNMGLPFIREHDASLYRLAKNELLSLGAKIHGDFGSGAVLLFSLPGFVSSDIAAKLGDSGICVRAGLHCSPLAHKALDTGGDAVRISFSPMNAESDIHGLIKELRKIQLEK